MGDLKISRKISGFHVRFQDFAKDFKISRKISRFQISLEVYEISASGEPLDLGNRYTQMDFGVKACRQGCSDQVHCLKIQRRSWSFEPGCLHLEATLHFFQSSL